MIGMRGWSFPIGRFLGVDVRIHTFFMLLLGLSIGYASVSGVSGGRWFALWLLLLLAVIVREVARAIAAAWFGLELRSVLLLPTGGLLSYATSESTDLAGTPEMQKRMAVVGPIANIGFGLLLAALVLTVAPQINLFERPWITPSHLLRTAVWVNLLLGAVNLLPASPLDGGRVFRGEFAKAHGALKGTRAAAGLGQVIALSLIVGGLLLPSMWLIMLGAFVMIGAHMEDQGLLLQTDVDAVRMRDVMVMTRSFQTAQPDDSLVKTLRRIMAGQGAQMVPVLEGDRIVGIITPQNLAHSMGLLNQRRRIRQQEQ